MMFCSDSTTIVLYTENVAVIFFVYINFYKSFFLIDIIYGVAYQILEQLLHAGGVGFNNRQLIFNFNLYMLRHVNHGNDIFYKGLKIDLFT